MKTKQQKKGEKLCLMPGPQCRERRIFKTLSSISRCSIKLFKKSNKSSCLKCQICNKQSIKKQNTWHSVRIGLISINFLRVCLIRIMFKWRAIYANVPRMDQRRRNFTRIIQPQTVNDMPMFAQWENALF